MRYFEDKTGVVFGYDPASQSALIAGAQTAGWTEVTSSWPPPATTAQLLAAFQSQVRAALADTDTTMLRVGEAVSLGLTSWTTPDVVTWVTYRRALRTLLSAVTVTDIPTKPAYPSGT